MRVEITRSGGFAGTVRTWVLEVSRSEAEQRWIPLAEAEAGAVDGETGPVQRDRFSYRIRVGYVEVQFPESRLVEPWRELIARARSADQDVTGQGVGQGGTARGAPRNPPELL